MKLIYCPDCKDIVRLMGDTRVCKCGGSRGRYLNELVAVIGGRAIPLGFTNDSFLWALKRRPEYGLGVMFNAFVIPVECDAIIDEEEAAEVWGEYL